MNLNEKINELWAKTKSGELNDRQARFAAIERLTDEYIDATDKRPEPVQLDRLASLCLFEEMTNPHPDKMTREEYPIMSATQYARKTTGRHVRRQDKNGNLQPLKREVPLSLANCIGSDGQNYRYPKRRRIDIVEEMDMEFNGKRREHDDD